MRQLAYYRTIPDNQKKSRYDSQIEHHFPPLNHGKYLLSYLEDMGYSINGVMGRASLSFSEIKSYADVMCLNLKSWEFRTLKILSVEYTNQLMDKDEYADIPFGSATISIEKLDEMMDRVKSFKKKK